MLQNGLVDLIFLLINFLQCFKEDPKLTIVNLISIKCLLQIQDEGELMSDENYNIRSMLLNYGLEEILIQSDFQNSNNEEIFKNTSQILEYIESLNNTINYNV